MTLTHISEKKYFLYRYFMLDKLPKAVYNVSVRYPYGKAVVILTRSKTEPRGIPLAEEEAAVMAAIRKATANGGSAEVKRTTDGHYKVYAVEKHIVHSK